MVDGQVHFDSKRSRFDEAHYHIIQRAYGTYDKGDYGPLGLFMLDDYQTFLAHDAGNLYKFSTTHVHAALTKLHKEAEQGRANATRVAHD